MITQEQIQKELEELNNLAFDFNEQLKKMSKMGLRIVWATHFHEDGPEDQETRHNDDIRIRVRRANIELIAKIKHDDDKVD